MSDMDLNGHWTNPNLFTPWAGNAWIQIPSPLELALDESKSLHPHTYLVWKSIPPFRSIHILQNQK